MLTFNLFKGDCLEVMNDIPDGSIDLVLTDPPYGTTACKWDTVIPFEPMWEHLKRIIKPNGAMVLFGSEPFSSMLRCSNLKMYKYDWVWRKSRVSHFAQAPYRPLTITENIIVFSNGGTSKNAGVRMSYYPQGLKDCSKICRGKGHSDHRPSSVKQNDYIQTKTGYPLQILEFSSDSAKLHPTQKPVALMEYMVKTYTNEGETVLDFTMGSFTTAIACLNTKRSFIGIEKDEHYFQVGKDRLEKHLYTLDYTPKIIYNQV